MSSTLHIYGLFSNTLFAQRHCVDQDGNDVLVQDQETDDEESDEHDHNHEESEESESAEKTNCHFHAGVE